MPKELIIVGVALLFGAWFVIDQRTLPEKLGLIFIIFLIYIAYQYLGGASLPDMYHSFIQFFHSEPPPPAE